MLRPEGLWLSAMTWRQLLSSLCAAVGRFIAARDDLAAAADKLMCRDWAFSGSFEDFVPLGEKKAGKI